MNAVRSRRLVAVSVPLCVVVVAAGACTSSGGPHAMSLADVGAEKLAPFVGSALGSQCSTLPLPEGAVGRACHNSESQAGTESRMTLEPGRYAVVLLCEKSGAATYTVTNVPSVSTPVTVDCGKEGVAVAPLFKLSKLTDVTVQSTFDGQGHAVTTIMKEP